MIPSSPNVLRPSIGWLGCGIFVWTLLLAPCWGEEDETPEETIAVWIHQVHHKDPEIAASAAKRLGEQSEQGKQSEQLEFIVSSLVTALADERNVPSEFFRPSGSEQVADVASRALSKIGGPAIPALERQIVNNDNPEVRAKAIRTITKMGPEGKAALPTLTQAIKDDSDPYVRNVAIYAVQEMGDQAEAAIPALLEAMRGEDSSIRLQAMSALPKVAKQPSNFLDAFTERLKDSHPPVRAVALRIIGELGAAAREAVPEMMQLLNDRELVVRGYHSEPVAASACRALAAMGEAGKPAVPKIRPLLQDSDEYLRVEAALAYALLSHKDSDALQVLIASAQDDARGFGPAYQALIALAKLGPRALPALPVITELLKHEDNLVRIHAVDAVYAIAPDRANSWTIPLGDDPDNFVRLRVINKLKTSPPNQKAALELLLKRLSDPWHAVRHASIEQLANMGSQARSALPALQRRLEEEPKDQLKEKVRLAIDQIEADE